eukprot:1148543-Pelagomonas_calceolata.AAC.2
MPCMHLIHLDSKGSHLVEGNESMYAKQPQHVALPETMSNPQDMMTEKQKTTRLDKDLQLELAGIPPPGTIQ